MATHTDKLQQSIRVQEDTVHGNIFSRLVNGTICFLWNWNSVHSTIIECRETISTSCAELASLRKLNLDSKKVHTLTVATHWANRRFMVDPRNFLTLQNRWTLPTWRNAWRNAKENAMQLSCRALTRLLHRGRGRCAPPPATLSYSNPINIVSMRVIVTNDVYEKNS